MNGASLTFSIEWKGIKRLLGHSLKTRQFLFVEPRDYGKSNAKSTCHHQNGSILADIPWAVASQQRSHHWTEVECSGQRFADTFWDYEPTASWCWDSLLGDESKEETWKKHKMCDQQKKLLGALWFFWGLGSSNCGVCWVVVSNIFYFHSYFGKISNLTTVKNFSDWLKRPTSIQYNDIDMYIYILYIYNI